MCTLMVLLLPEDNPKDTIFPGAGCSGYRNSGILKLMDTFNLIVELMDSSNLT